MMTLGGTTRYPPLVMGMVTGVVTEMDWNCRHGDPAATGPQLVWRTMVWEIP